MTQENSIEFAQISLARSLMEEGSEQSPRGQKTLELINYSSMLGHPAQRICRIKARKINLSYLAAEFIWYLSADLSSRKIGKHASLWNDIADDREKVVSNYGRWIYQGGTDSVFSRALRTLEDDPDSRQAIIPIYTAQRATMNPRDIPCTLFLQFFIRDGMLHCVTMMRSNDAVYGFTNDVFQFTMIQELALAYLRSKYPDLELGFYYHHAGSMHVYERHFDMMEQISQEDGSTIDGDIPHEMERMPPFQSYDHFEIWRLWMVQQFWADRIRGERISIDKVGSEMANYWHKTIKETLQYEQR